MKYGHLATLVQLGVGIHAGTALLQLYGEIGLQPLVRTLARIETLVKERNISDDDLVAEFHDLESNFDIFKIQLFNEFKKYIFGNLAVAAILVFVLIIISYMFEETLSISISIFVVAISILPGPITLVVLWFDAARQTQPLKSRADDLERKLLGQSGGASATIC